MKRLFSDPVAWTSAAILAGLSLYAHFVWYPGQPSPNNAGRPGSRWAGQEVAYLYAHVLANIEGGLRLESYDEVFVVMGDFPPLIPDERVSVRVRVEEDGRFTLVRWQRHTGRTGKALISALGLAGALLYLILTLRWKKDEGGLCPT